VSALPKQSKSLIFIGILEYLEGTVGVVNCSFSLCFEGDD